LLLHNLPVNQRVENTLTLGRRAKLLVGLMEMVKAGGRACGLLTFRRNGRACGCGGDQLTELSSLHLRSSSLVISGYFSHVVRYQRNRTSAIAGICPPMPMS